jgi:hypothetical protein
MDSPPELFLKYHYAETKDLLKSFLTLLSATLVLSIAFAEKIVEFKSSTRWAKSFLMCCWLTLIVSIVLCGFSICAIALAGGASLSDLYVGSKDISPAVEFWAQYSIIFALWAGASFVFALIFMILAAVQSMWKKDVILDEKTDRVT